MEIADEQALDDFVGEWVAGTLPKPRWTHAAHVAVSAYYAFDHDPDELFEVMKTGIIHYNRCVGTVNGLDSGYHETLTRLWSRVVGDLVREGKFATRLEAVRGAVSAFGEDRGLHSRYYTFDVVKDRRARREWVPPDCEPAG
jgi:hypothetical protein